MTARAGPRAVRSEQTPMLDIIRRGIVIGLRPTARNAWHLAVTGASIAILLVMTAVVLPGQVYGWEVDVVKWAQDIGYPRWAFTLTANRLTNADTPEGAVVIASLISGLWLMRARVESFLIALTVPLHVAANLPKLFVDRERPSGLIDGIDGDGGMKSFPSGHAEFAVLFYGFLVYLTLMRIAHPLARAALIVGWLVMLMLVGFARMEVGKHWPLDIVAGYAIGVGLLSLVVWLHTSLTQAEEGEG